MSNTENVRSTAPIAGVDSGEGRDFKSDLTRLLNSYSKENGSDTPDWILAEYLLSCLSAFDRATHARVPFHCSDEAKCLEWSHRMKREEAERIDGTKRTAPSEREEVSAQPK